MKVYYGMHGIFFMFRDTDRNQFKDLKNRGSEDGCGVRTMDVIIMIQRMTSAIEKDEVGSLEFVGWTRVRENINT